MNPARITLIVTEGTLEGNEYVFEETAWCSVGRAEDCTIRLASSVEHIAISRHHCLFEIAPPGIRVRDLGSLNGTYVNGKKIGQRPPYLPPEDTEINSTKTQELRDGDEVRVGTTVFRISLESAAEVSDSAYFPMQVNEH